MPEGKKRELERDIGNARINGPETTLEQMEEGHYLTGNHNLREVYERVKDKLRRPLVYTSYVTDLNGVVGIKGVGGVPLPIRSSEEWEHILRWKLSQADIIITATGHMNRVEELGEKAQNVFNSFDKGQPLEKHGEWRLEQGYERRNPDVAVVSRSLDFDFPPFLTQNGRKIFIFTTHKMENSPKARAFGKRGAVVIGAGDTEVDGKIMIERLGQGGFGLVMHTTTPKILEGLPLDRLYVTQAQREIPGNPETFITIPINQNMPEEVVLYGAEFKLTDSYVHEGAKAADGELISLKFMTWDSKQLIEALNS